MLAWFYTLKDGLQFVKLLCFLFYMFDFDFSPANVFTFSPVAAVTKAVNYFKTLPSASSKQRMSLAKKSAAPQSTCTKEKSLNSKSARGRQFLFRDRKCKALSHPTGIFLSRFQ